jgi:parallel beta-helix repeat protein
VRRGLPSITVSLLLITALFVGLDLSFDIIPNVSSGLIEVDDSGGKDHLTIQEGVDAAQPGDTVLVYAGMYDEDVVIDKTINLTGEDRDNTIINASNTGIWIENIHHVNITGFTIINGSSRGIRLMNSNNSLIENNRVELNLYGIKIMDSNNTIVRNNIASNNSNYHGIYLARSTNITVKNNICYGNKGNGILIFDNSNYNHIIGNNCSYNEDGIRIDSGENINYFEQNILDSNIRYGIWDASDGGNVFKNITIKNSETGILISIWAKNDIIINSTIENSINEDIYNAVLNEFFTSINTTFNKSKVTYNFDTSKLEVQWYLNINIIDYLGNPIPNAKVKIEDNINGIYNQLLTTDINGQIKWLTITEYVEQDTDGNTIGEKTYFSPHKIIAWNETLVGYAQSFMNESKTITIVLYNGTLLDIEPGWNLISLPRPQSDTNLQTVLQPVENQYNAAQWYNVTNTNDPWKHHHVSKPSNLNDLKKINHTMGFWLYIADPAGTTLVVIGDELTFNQNISIYPGWNLVGFPSKINKTRDVGLGTLNFGSDIDSIWTYNSTIDKWIELIDVMDYFEVGKGYWIHSRVTKVWNVPL